MKTTQTLKDSSSVRINLAQAMIGSTVGLFNFKQEITHGIVSGVLTEAGKPKILVDGHRYDLSQIFSVMPSYLN